MRATTAITSICIITMLFGCGAADSTSNTTTGNNSNNQVATTTAGADLALADELQFLGLWEGRFVNDTFRIPEHLKQYVSFNAGYRTAVYRKRWDQNCFDIEAATYKAEGIDLYRDSDGVLAKIIVTGYTLKMTFPEHDNQSITYRRDQTVAEHDIQICTDEAPLLKSKIVDDEIRIWSKMPMLKPEDL